MQVALQFIPGLFAQQQQTHDFHPAGCRTGRAADEHQDQQQELGKCRPLIEIGSDEAGRGHDRRRSEQGVAKCFAGRQAGGKDKIRGNKKCRYRHNAQIHFELNIAEQMPPAFFPNQEIQTEVAAGNRHEGNNDQLNRQTVIVQDTGVFCREATGCHGCKCMVDCIEQRHACYHEQYDLHQCKYTINRPEGEGGIPQARYNTVGDRTGDFGAEHVDGAGADFR